MQLSEYFTLEELTASTTAKMKRIDNTPDKKACLRLAYLCQNILAPIRRKYGFPIYVNSGYRCPELNKAVNGSATSQHLTGDAADITCKATSRAELFRLIKKMVESGEIEVGQLIWEYGDAANPSWIHVSNPREGKLNNQVLYLF